MAPRPRKNHMHSWMLLGLLVEPVRRAHLAPQGPGWCKPPSKKRWWGSFPYHQHSSIWRGPGHTQENSPNELEMQSKNRTTNHGTSPPNTPLAHPRYEIILPSRTPLSFRAPHLRGHFRNKHTRREKKSYWGRYLKFISFTSYSSHWAGPIPKVLLIFSEYLTFS